MKTIVVVGGGFAGVRVAPDLTARANPELREPPHLGGERHDDNQMLGVGRGRGRQRRRPALERYALMPTLGLSTTNGWLNVTPDMRVESSASIWTLGDCARIWNGVENRPNPATAQAA